jgi:hypothetical protein
MKKCNLAAVLVSAPDSALVHVRFIKATAYGSFGVDSVNHLFKPLRSKNNNVQADGAGHRNRPHTQNRQNNQRQRAFNTGNGRCMHKFLPLAVMFSIKHSLFPEF